MALSNWDTLAFDQHAQPCDGTLIGFDGGKVRIYKNWVYVSDPKMWTPGRGYVQHTIAQINSGDIHISEFSIFASRSNSQDSVFVLAICRRYGDNAETRCMAGIGCSGYTDPSMMIYEAAGVNVNDWDDCFISNGSQIEIHCLKGAEQQTYQLVSEDRFQSQWVGVLPETRDEFFAWIAEQIDPKDTEIPNAGWLEKCRNQGGLRFNQGDAYFAQMGIDHLDATPLGESNEPIIRKLIDNIK